MTLRDSDEKCNSILKREHDGDNEASSLKRSKPEIFEEPNFLRHGPTSRGVARYIYPDTCRPSNPQYGFNREIFMNDVRRKLALEGKRVVLAPRFLCVSSSVRTH